MLKVRGVFTTSIICGYVINNRKSKGTYDITKCQIDISHFQTFELFEQSTKCISRQHRTLRNFRVKYIPIEKILRRIISRTEIFVQIWNVHAPV